MGEQTTAVMRNLHVTLLHPAAATSHQEAETQIQHQHQHQATSRLASSKLHRHPMDDSEDKTPPLVYAQDHRGQGSQQLTTANWQKNTDNQHGCSLIYMIYVCACVRVFFRV